MRLNVLAKMFKDTRELEALWQDEEVIYALGIASGEILPNQFITRIHKEAFCAAFIIMDGNALPLISYVFSTFKQDLYDCATYTINICKKNGLKINTDALQEYYMGTGDASVRYGVDIALEMQNHAFEDYTNLELMLYSISRPEFIDKLPQFDDKSVFPILLCSDRIASAAFKHTVFQEKNKVLDTVIRILVDENVNPYFRFRGSGSIRSDAVYMMVEKFPECAIFMENPTKEDIDLAVLNNHTSAMYFEDLSYEQLKLAKFRQEYFGELNDDADYLEYINYNRFIGKRLGDPYGYDTFSVPQDSFKQWLRFRAGSQLYKLSPYVVAKAYELLGCEAIEAAVWRDYRLVSDINEVSDDLLQLVTIVRAKRYDGNDGDEFKHWYTDRIQRMAMLKATHDLGDMNMF